MDSIICEVSVLQDLSVATRTIGKVPSVDFFAAVVNEFDGAWAGQVCKECVAWGDFVGVDAAKADTAAEEVALLHYVELREIP
jgi:hypothetical protein